jgi:holliday junction DNA helicase RuvA
VIASLKGRIEALGTDWAIIEVNGVGFHVNTPTSTLSVLGSAGDHVRLFTHLHVREDILALYGFATPEELSLFQILTGVSGVGPKLALSILSALKPGQIATAIASENLDMLTTVPGIGKKIAGRLILELKDKIGSGLQLTPLQVSQSNVEVVAALTALGYSTNESTRAVASIPSEDLSLEDKVRAALAYFASQ